MALPFSLPVIVTEAKRRKMATLLKSFALHLAFVVLTGAGVGTSGALFAQEPEEEPEAEAPAPAAEDAGATDESDASDTDDNKDSKDADDSSDAHDSSDADADDDADGDDEYADVEQPADYADDAIPTDTQVDPTRTSWDVVDFEDDGDNQEDIEEAPHPGIREPEDMPTVRPHLRKAPKSKGDDGDFLRSAGGRPIPDKGAPWQAEIYGPFEAERFPEKSRVGKALWQLQHYCGGSLIAHDWVLTAAHCIDQDMVNAGYRVRLGAENISRDDGMTFRIDRIVRHADFDAKPLPAHPNMYANDIALVHIVDDGPPRHRDPTQIREIALHKGPPPPDGTEVTGTGWGKTLPVEGNAPNAVLLKVNLKVMDQTHCTSLPGYGPEKIQGKVFCAANPQRSTCQGDSGGPIILTNGAPTLVGIISWGKKRCTGDGQPGVYTRVATYIDWISQAMKLDPQKNSLP